MKTIKERKGIGLSEILYGKPVVESIYADLRERIDRLKEKGVDPRIDAIRLGSRPDDMAYERQVKNSCAKVGISVTVHELPETITQEALIETIDRLNDDSKVHGVLLFRPLPAHIDPEAVSQALAPEKDIDCMNPKNLSGVLVNDPDSIPPCTPEAVIATLKYYGKEIAGKNVVIVNRSLVLGKPLALLFLNENATVTICHSKTADLSSVTKRADIVVTGIGRANFFGMDYFDENTIITDVGINFSEGKLTGDVDFDAVSEHVRAITPVPGGIGTVTTAMLLTHLVNSAEKSLF